MQSTAAKDSTVVLIAIRVIKKDIGVREIAVLEHTATFNEMSVSGFNESNIYSENSIVILFYLDQVILPCNTDKNVYGIHKNT